MAEDFDSNADKTEEPSAHRLEQFRQRGEVASSRELTSALVLGGTILALSLSLVYMYEEFTYFFEWLFSLNVEIAMAEEGRKILVSRSAMLLVKCAAPVCVTAFALTILSNIIQVGVLFAPDVLTLKLERINPLSGFKKLLSVRSLVEALKAIFKFIIIFSISYVLLKDEFYKVTGHLHIDLLESFLVAKSLIFKVAFAIIFGLLALGGLDLIYQKMSYRKKLMLTKEEAKREHKEQEGSPEIKQRIKTIQRQMAQKRMMSDVPKADVIVTNPTHISVALKYDPETMISPIMLAKGPDHLAFKIREIASSHGIPIVENIALARTLYKTVKIGETIPRSLYKAVAEVLAFVYKLKRKKKAVG
ncbi:MAG: flagellar biosynthesis protein FlhB [Bdellovibrio sp.]|nr:flagellar biosynthesis protein FlhB [Bdellovibrio sp.]